MPMPYPLQLDIPKYHPAFTPGASSLAGDSLFDIRLPPAPPHHPTPALSAVPAGSPAHSVLSAGSSGSPTDAGQHSPRSPAGRQPSHSSVDEAGAIHSEPHQNARVFRDLPPSASAAAAADSRYLYSSPSYDHLANSPMNPPRDPYLPHDAYADHRRMSDPAIPGGYNNRPAFPPLNISRTHSNSAFYDHDPYAPTSAGLDHQPISPLHSDFGTGAMPYPHSATDTYGPSPPGSAQSATSPSMARHDDGSDSRKQYSFVALPGNTIKKRPRRRYDEIERLYQCSWKDCTKAYGTLNHLNAHVTMQKHGPKRSPAEFKEMRKKWRQQKKEAEAAANARQRRMAIQPDYPATNAYGLDNHRGYEGHRVGGYDRGYDHRGFDDRYDESRGAYAPMGAFPGSSGGSFGFDAVPRFQNESDERHRWSRAEQSYRGDGYLSTNANMGMGMGLGGLSSTGMSPSGLSPSGLSQSAGLSSNMASSSGLMQSSGLSHASGLSPSMGRMSDTSLLGYGLPPLPNDNSRYLDDPRRPSTGRSSAQGSGDEYH
ncbi:hypothetical protein FB107DRAFT_248159 [Schizophyllum commune]